MKRLFHVIHSFGAVDVRAETAAEALKKVFVPLGFRDVCAVIDAELIVQNDAVAGPFRAFIGEPFGALEVATKGGAQ